MLCYQMIPLPFVESNSNNNSNQITKNHSSTSLKSDLEADDHLQTEPSTEMTSSEDKLSTGDFV